MASKFDTANLMAVPDLFGQFQREKRSKVFPTLARTQLSEETKDGKLPILDMVAGPAGALLHRFGTSTLTSCHRESLAVSILESGQVVFASVKPYTDYGSGASC